MELRPYQKDCINALFSTLKEDDRAFVQLSTGSGKTVIFSELIKRSLKQKPNLRFLIIVHKKVLVSQTAKYFKDVGIYCAGLNEKDLTKNVTIATYQSIQNAETTLYDCVIIDEYHTINPKYLELGKKAIGFSATMFDDKGNSIVEKLSYIITMKELTRQKFLTPLVFQGYCADITIDISGVPKYKNDYSLSQLNSTYMDNVDKIKLQIKDAISKSKDRKKIAVLCLTIEHAKLVHGELLKQGETSTILHSQLSDIDWQKNMTTFVFSGRWCVSVMQITTGFDCSELDCLVLFRPTRSQVLYRQAIGRLTRLHEGKKNGLILDYGSVREYLGDPYEPPNAKKKVDSCKQCISCYLYVPMNTKVCACGEVFKVMCDYCFEMKNYGEKCKCNNTPKKELSLDNLSVSIPKTQWWLNVSSMSYLPYTAKSGREMYRVKYITDATNMNLWTVTGYDFIEPERTPKTIMVKKEGKYYNVKAKIYD